MTRLGGGLSTVAPASCPRAVTVERSRVPSPPGEVVVSATLPWPPATPAARRRLRAGIAAYAVLCSGLVLIFANGFAGPHGFLGGNAYLLVAAAMLALLPVGAGEDGPVSWGAPARRGSR